MYEIFENVPQTVKDRARFWTELALLHFDPVEAIRTIQHYIDSCENEDEKEFADFYFRLCLEHKYGG